MVENGKNPARSRRWLRRAGWILGVVAVLALLVVFVLPSPIARWVIASQLNDMGIEHDGVGTVSIDLWNRHISAGPISFRDDNKGPGKIGSVDIRFSLTNLLEKRALIQSFTVTGVEITARRDRQGRITVNGIAPPVSQTQESSGAGGEEGSSFGVGISALVFRDSTLILEDFTGGRLTLDLTRLELWDFRSWEPDVPGEFRLVATLNSMVIETAGQATPFAETVRASGNLSLSSLTLDSVAAFTGPTGLARQGGAFSLVLQHSSMLAPDGRLEVDMNGTMVAREVDVATPEGEAVTLAELENPFDAVVTVTTENAIEVVGESEFLARDLSLTSGNGETLRADEIGANITEMDLKKFAALREGLAGIDTATPQPDNAEQAAWSLIDLAIDLIINAGKEVLRHRIEGSAAIAVTMMGIEAVQPGTSSTLKLAAGKVASGKIHVSSVDELWKLTTPLVVSLDDLTAESPGSKALISQMTAEIDAFQGETDFDKANLSLDMEIKVGAASASEDGAEVSFDSLLLQADPLTIDKESGVGTRTGPGTLETSMTLESDALRMAAGGADVRLESLMLQAGQVKYTEDTDWSILEGMVKADLGPLRLSGDGTNASLASLAFQADPVTITGRSEVEAAFTADAGKLNVEAGGSKASMNGLSLQAPRFKAGGDPGSATVETAVTLSASGVNAAAGGAQPATVKAGQLAVSLDPLKFVQASGSTDVSGRIQARNASAEAAGAAAAAESLILVLKSIAGKIIPSPDLKGAAALTMENLDLSLPSMEATASLGSVEVQADTVRLSDAEKALSGSVTAGAVDAELAGGMPSGNATLGGVTVTGLAASLPAGGAPAVAMDAVTLDALNAEVTIAAFGGGQDAAGAGGDSNNGSTGNGNGSDSRISVQTLTISPGSTVTVLDSSTGEAVRIPISVEKLVAGPVDTAAPNTATSLDAALGIGDVSKVTAQGTAKPLASAPDFDMQTTVENFPLTLVSPFVTQLSGLTVESGSLDVGANGTAVNGDLNGKVDLRVADFHVGEPDAETAARFQENYGVPVGFAVGLLKDSNGVIQLSLPVSGTVSEPVIDYSEVISQAIGGAIASIFPSGLFSSDAGFSIKPVEFPPGSSDLTEEGLSTAAPLASALKEKPELRLRVCGKGARADLLAMRGKDPAGPLPAEKTTDEEAQSLLKLAGARSTSLRQYLVGQGVAEQRIGECRTSYSVESDAPPRAEVQL